MDIQEIHSQLFMVMGDLGWWPAGSKDEVIIGTILTQNTSWNNVSKALEQLRKIDCLCLDCISAKSKDELSRLIKSSGFYKQKAERLIDLASRILGKYGSISRMAEADTSELVDFLSRIKGVGKETMDSILLYALDKPVFVVDKYTERIFTRTGVISNATEMKRLKEAIPGILENDIGKLKNFHGMIVKLAKENCRKKPLCSGCQLSSSCNYYNETMLP